MSDVRRAESQTETRKRIIDAAASLLHEKGPASVTTRGVAQAAGVQAPTIYRLFGDKDGLLEAVAEQVMTTYVTAKAAIVAATSDDIDPVSDLRAGWQTQIDFGLANPDLFRLLSDPARVRASAAARSGKDVLATRVRRVAQTGRLRVSEPRAVDLIQAAGTGVIQTLLATPVDERDSGLSDALYDAVMGQILTECPTPTEPADTTDAHHVDRRPSPARSSPGADAPRAAAVTLRASVLDLDVLTPAERQLLCDWLDRAIDAL